MQSGAVSPQAVRFGVFEVDFSAAELRKRGRKIPLQDQPFKVLALLLRSRGELVTREELQRALWPGDTFGEFDEGLNKAIQKLRQALDDSTDNPRFIETLPRKGYRFIAAVESIPAEVCLTAPEPHPGLPAWLPKREIVAWSLVAFLSLVLMIVASVRQRPSEAHVVRFQIVPPENVITYQDDVPAVSPNGRHLVFRGTDPDGKSHVWVHSLDSTATQSLPGIEEENGIPFYPFWSPDSRFVAFFQNGKLKKIDITAGGLPRVLCDAPFNIGGAAWSQSGTILFSSHSALYRVSSDGGEPTLALGLDKSRKELWQLYPHFLPDGRHFLYLSKSSDATRSGIYLASLGSNQTRRLLSSDSNAAYTPPGFLIFGQQEKLLVQPFDERTLRLTGDPLPLPERLARITGSSEFVFSISQTGVLAYRDPAAYKMQLAWYTRDGKRQGSVGEPGSYLQIALSPDEKRVAVERSDNIWILQLSTGVFSRLTFSEDSDPVWSPDGREFMFTSLRGGRWGLYRKVVGGRDETLTFDSGEPLFSENWLPDGRSIIMIDFRGRAFSQLQLSDAPKPEPLLKSEFAKDEPHVSPDGRWIAYNATDSGRWEVYVAAFPGFTGKRQVSSNGGGEALWRRDGKELFYLGMDGKLMAVDVKAGDVIETGAPKALFQTRLVVVAVNDQYCVTGDGQRFLLAEPVSNSAGRMNMVLNWTAALKR
jgi:Tol biopolymer transport system component/DNA-binding winged helix-turn-helix (wHTH) protein